MCQHCGPCAYVQEPEMQDLLQGHAEFHDRKRVLYGKFCSIAFISFKKKKSVNLLYLNIGTAS